MKTVEIKEDKINIVHTPTKDVMVYMVDKLRFKYQWKSTITQASSMIRSYVYSTVIIDLSIIVDYHIILVQTYHGVKGVVHAIKDIRMAGGNISGTYIILYMVK
jgi:hypothetical protein